MMLKILVFVKIEWYDVIALQTVASAAQFLYFTN